MSLQLIQRRFGYGAARLPIGLPNDSIALFEAASTPTNLERYIAAMPGLLCIALAALVASTASFSPSLGTSPVALVEPSTIVLDLWNDSPTITIRPPIPVAASQPIDLPPVPTLVPFVSPAELVKNEPPQASPSPFDPRILIMAPTLTATIDPIGVATGLPAQLLTRTDDFASAPRERRRPTLQTTGKRNPLAQIADRIPTTRDFTASVTDIGLGVPSVAALPSRQRPSDSKNAGASSDAPRWSGQTDRKYFLAALVQNSLPDGPPRPQSGPRPHVAAAAAASEIAREIRGRVANQARQERWQEVPLDELPECSPPGRQDELKKRILLSASQTRELECSNQDGHYRFLETRNLNAFLMWSRPNPHSSSQPRPARDVCDVLARALRCLEEESM